MAVGIYPNPFSDVLNIDLTGPLASPLRLELLAANGQVVWAASGDELVLGRHYVSNKMLPVGVYWLVVTGEDGKRAVSKVMKRR